MDYITLLGAHNIDLFGRPYKAIIPKDSNPGTVQVSMGGVGRNIAHNLLLLGLDIKFMTVFGGDFYADVLKKHYEDIGLNYRDSLVLKNERTSTYMYITDDNGDMMLAVSDMEIYDKLKRVNISDRLPIINKGRLCVADTNFPESILVFLAENLEVPLFVDAVSTTKAMKLKTIFDKIHTLKVNALEAEVLTGIKIRSEKSARLAAKEFISEGIKQIFISLGKDGLYCSNGESFYLIPPVPTNITNTTGAGDSLMAGIVWGYSEGYDLRRSALAGLLCASICIGSSETVNPDLSGGIVRDRVKAFERFGF